MKKNRTDNPYVVCPYFKCEDSQTIFCEGVEEDNAIHMAFSTPSIRKNYQDRYCKTLWKRCMVADILNKKYDYK